MFPPPTLTEATYLMPPVSTRNSIGAYVALQSPPVLMRVAKNETGNPSLLPAPRRLYVNVGLLVLSRPAVVIHAVARPAGPSRAL